MVCSPAFCLFQFHGGRKILRLPPFRNSSQPLGHTAGTASPPPFYGARLNFYREKCSVFSYLVDSRRIVHTHAARRYLPPGSRFLGKKKYLGGIRTHAIDLSSRTRQRVEQSEAHSASPTHGRKPTYHAAKKTQTEHAFPAKPLTEDM